MKTAFFVFWALYATAAFGQSVAATSASISSISSEPQPVQIASHPEHATTHALGSEQNLLSASNSTSAHGERPLWEFVKPKVETPLGDRARALKTQHEGGKKATRVFEN